MVCVLFDIAFAIITHSVFINFIKKSVYSLI